MVTVNLGFRFYVLRFTFYVLRFTFYVLRFTFYGGRRLGLVINSYNLLCLYCLLFYFKSESSFFNLMFTVYFLLSLKSYMLFTVYCLLFLKQ